MWAGLRWLLEGDSLEQQERSGLGSEDLGSHER